jgi:NAD(P)-dependent dehydrogenase (short-subunit alcohol dehydrogenase family)
MKTHNKIALVTGGSRGLGRDMVLSIAKRGLDVIITYNNNRELADAVAAQIRSIGQKAAVLKLNVARTETFSAFFDQLKVTLKETFRVTKIDFLINNAGIGLNTPFASTTEHQFDELVSVQFKGPFFLTQNALEILNDNGGIVNISTGLTRFALLGYSAYASMKGAMEILMKYQAKELAERGIRSNIVAPGAIETDFGGGVVRDHPGVNSFIAGITALGRAGRPEDIGGVVAFLCTDDANWINAQRIEVSGGMVL